MGGVVGVTVVRGRGRRDRGSRIGGGGGGSCRSSGGSSTSGSGGWEGGEGSSLLLLSRRWSHCGGGCGVAVVLLKCSCISKALSTLSRLVYIFADASNVFGLFTSFSRTRRDIYGSEILA